MSISSSDPAGELRVLSGADAIRRNPATYWGTSTPRHENAIAGVLVQMAEAQSISPLVLKHEGWSIVGSPTDWIESGLTHGRTVRELFERAAPIHGPVAGGLRVEFVLTTLAEELLLWRDNAVLVIKGACNGAPLKLLQERFHGHVAVAFRGNTYEKRESA